MTRRGDVLISLLLALVAAAICLIDPNDAFISENDVYMLRQAAHYFHFLSWSASDFASLEHALAKFLAFGWAFFYYFHGPFPPFFMAAYMKLGEMLGVPFSPFFAQSSVVPLHVTTVVVFVFVLRRLGVSSFAAAIGGAMLALSPMLVGFSRAFGASWLAVVPFHQAVLLAAFIILDKRRWTQFIAGLLVAHMAFADVLAPLQLAAILGARIAAETFTSPATLREIVARGFASLRALGGPALWTPIVGAAAIVAVYNAVAVTVGRGIGLMPTLFVYPFVTYSPGVLASPGAHFGLGDWAVIAGVSFGTLGAPIAAMIAMSTIALRSPIPQRSRIGFWYAAIAGTGYFTIFYIYADTTTGSGDFPWYAYPVYTVLPLLLGAILLLDRVVSRSRLGVVLGIGLVVNVIASTLTYIWRVPVAPWSSLLIVNEDARPSGDNIGIRRENFGTRAAAYVMREVLLRHHAHVGDAPIGLLYYRKPFDKRFGAFLVEAGLDGTARWYRNQIGAAPLLTTHVVTIDEDRGAGHLIQRYDFGDRAYPREQLSISEESCAARTCVVVDLTGRGPISLLIDRMQRKADIVVTSGDRQVFALSFIGGDPALFEFQPHQSIDVVTLDRRFMSRWTRFDDYLPPPDLAALGAKLRSTLDRLRLSPKNIVD
jgi:hypothetical protein